MDKEFSSSFWVIKLFSKKRNLCNGSTCSFLLQFSNCLWQAKDAPIITSMLSGYKVIEGSYLKVLSDFLKQIFR